MSTALLFATLGEHLSPARAQTDEIQVYTGEINRTGEFSVTSHSNYAAIGRKQPAFPGGLIPDGTLNGVLEYAYGVNEWFEAGAYLPLYSLTRNGDFRINGGKLRALFAVPEAAKRTFFYAVNFELSYNARHWEQDRIAGEIRPIIGGRFGAVDFIVNPILDTGFNGFGALDFAPAVRLAYNFSPSWGAGFEHYADFGELRHIEPASQQQHTLFAVVDYSDDPFSAEFGIGHGFTQASDDLVLKLILTRSF